MGIRYDFSVYFDGDGLLSPNPQSQPPVGKGSDNAPMFTAEFYIILKKLNQLADQDYADFDEKIQCCINSRGMLCRAPVDQDESIEEVDDWYGTLNGCVQMGNTTIPRVLLWGLIVNWGFMDNNNPGSLWNWNAFLPRQLQLVAATVAASFPGWKNPLNIVTRAAFFPLFAFSALIIAISCMGTDIGNTDARRLAWHLWQSLKSSSVLCWLAGKIWLHRLYKDYGPTGMQNVAAIYYQPKNTNPYAKYWVTE